MKAGIVMTGTGPVLRPMIGTNNTRAISEVTPTSRATATMLKPEESDRSDIAQTFSTSGLPSRPVGRKIRTSTRIENAATSLYSALK